MTGRLRRDDANARGLERLRRTVRIRLKRQARDLAHDFSHADRVARSALKIAERTANDEGWDIDGDVLEAACLLHEIGRGAEQRGEVIADASVRIAEEMLRGDALAELVWPVCEAILSHMSPGRAPETPEARILRDADTLEELGAIGLARLFTTAVTQAVPLLYDLDDPLARNRELDDSAHVLDRLPKRHVHLEARVETAYARAEAARRGRTLAAYYKAFMKEAGVLE